VFKHEPGLDRTATPSLDEVLAVRELQNAELDRWLSTVTADELSKPAPVPESSGWPAYARGKSVLGLRRSGRTAKEARAFARASLCSEHPQTARMQLTDQLTDEKPVVLLLPTLAAPVNRLGLQATVVGSST